MWTIGLHRLPRRIRRELPKTVEDSFGDLSGWHITGLRRRQQRRLARLARYCRPVGSLSCAVRAAHVAKTSYVLLVIVAGRRRHLRLQLRVVDTLQRQVLAGTDGPLRIRQWSADTADVAESLVAAPGLAGSTPQAGPAASAAPGGKTSGSGGAALSTGAPAAATKGPAAAATASAGQATTPGAADSTPPPPAPPPTPAAAGTAPAGKAAATTPTASPSTAAGTAGKQAAAAAPNGAAETEPGKASAAAAPAPSSASPSITEVHAAPVGEPASVSSAAAPAPATSPSTARGRSFGIGLHADLLVPSGRAGSASFAGSLTPKAGRTATGAVMLELRYYLPFWHGDLGLGLEAGWYHLGQSGQRQNPNDPDFSNFRFSWSIQTLPLFIGPVYRLPLHLPVELSCGAGFAYELVWATTTYKAGGTAVTDATQSGGALGFYLTAGAALALGPGKITAALRYTNIRTDLKFSTIYNGAYNSKLGDLGGTSLLVGYRIDL